jgi:hypothetical protein
MWSQWGQGEPSSQIIEPSRCGSRMGHIHIWFSSDSLSTMLDGPAVNPQMGIRAGGDGMQTSIATDSRSKKRAASSVLAFTFAVLTFILGNTTTGFAIPAFARKYGLRCSACHVAWPVLNDFGWRFKDNGYQLMNDRDAPIWQNPAYWPVTFRVTPNWHRENSNKIAVDTAAGALTGETEITAHGFDLSGLDILTGGTLYKNISFLLTPSADNTATFHFESMFVRLDNLFNSPWLNVKFGKFELDNFLSEKRIMGLSNNGGIYQLYHFVPPGDNNTFGQIGDNQIGIEWLGHSLNDHTRISATVFSSNDGSPSLANSNSYSGYFAASQAFDLGGLGLQRVGAYAMVGSAPTFFLNQTTPTGAFVPTTPGATTGASVFSTAAVAGSGAGSKSFYRAGVFGDFYISKLDVALYYQHGWDDKFFATMTPANQPLPAGARNPVWNGGIVEPHLTINPQFIIFERNEWVRMSQQALGTDPITLLPIPSNRGDIDAYTFGYRWYPIMTSRAGFAFHNEYSWVRQRGTSPVSATDLTSNSLFFGLDFDF